MPENEIAEQEVIPAAPVFMAIPEGTARLNITWSGSNGDLPDPVPYDAADADLKRMATEAITNGDVPGIPADAGVNLQDFIVDRYAAKDDVPYARVFIRPKTPFGR